MEKKRPNILLIMTDQQRFDQLGYISNGYFDTPNLDKLALNGVIFNNAYSFATICIPSRGSLMTGLRPGRYNTQGIGSALEEGFWTMPHVLRENGYETALIGKMHFEPIRSRHGFDYMRMAEHLGMIYEPEELDDFTNWLVTKGKGDWRATHMFGPEESQQKAEYQKNQHAIPYFYDKKYHPTNWIADETVKYLKNRDNNKPFFLISSFPHPHSPFDPPEPYASMYDFEDAVLPDYDPEINSLLPEDIQEMMGNNKSFGLVNTEKIGVNLQRKISTYIRALIKQIDDAAGEILANINLDETVVLFTSDHGDYYGHRGLMLKSPGVPFEDIARVPLFVCGTGIPQGKNVENLVQSGDIAITCLKIAGIEIEKEQEFDAKSLVSFFEDKIIPDERTVFCWSNCDWHMIRCRDYKYFYNEPLRQEMLFNVIDDPAEKYNLADIPDYSSQLVKMRSKMKNELSKTVPVLSRFD